MPPRRERHRQTLRTISTTHKRHPVSVVQKNSKEHGIYGHGTSVPKPADTRDVQPVSPSIKATGQTYRTKVGNYTVQVVTCSSELQDLIRQIRSHCENFPVIGFDCEWWSIKGPRRPVALLQLASPGGLCVLARLCQMNSLPTALLNLLGDDRIMKVGVQPLEDGYKLQQDYGCKVVSTLDLRHLAHRLNVPRPYKLSALAERVTNLQMDTDWQIPASNWERYELSPRQIEYAAKDAIAGLLIARTFNKAIPLSGMVQYYDIPFKLCTPRQWRSVTG